MVLLNFSVSDFRRKVPKKGRDKKNLCNLIRAFGLVKTMLLKKKTPKIINKIKVIIMYGKKPMKGKSYGGKKGTKKKGYGKKK